MPNPKATAGILSLAAYIPRAFHDAEFIASQSETPAEIIRTKLGWYQKNVPGPGDHTVAMGLKTARKALYNSGLKPSDIDLVIWSGEEIKEYRNWPVGPKIQKELGLEEAWSFDIQQRCGTTLVALKLARDMIRADDRINNVLVASGYRNSDLIHYPNPRVRWMYYLAAGGAACVVQRDCPRNEILEGHFMTDGSFTWDVYVPQGGSAAPMTLKGLDEGKQYLDVMDPVGMKDRLDRLSLSNWLLCIDKALAKCGYTRADVDYLATLLVKRSAHDNLMSALGLRPEQTRYFAEFGHQGQNDQLLSLELAIEEGRIKDGDLILMVSAGIGYAWDVLLLRWGSRTGKE
jgi:3-oxoacyl-[acyl-carrier-protein] synthase-3